ncbi:MAG: phosphoribosylformylglycinamidine synthase subunit PurS [Bdellovibrionota bacterium]
MRAKIYVTPRKGVLDPQGKAIEGSLHSLGFKEAGEVKMGKYLTIELKGVTPSEARQRVQKMCEKLLTNPIVEDFTFEIEE